MIAPRHPGSGNSGAPAAALAQAGVRGSTVRSGERLASRRRVSECKTASRIVLSSFATSSARNRNAKYPFFCSSWRLRRSRRYAAGSARCCHLPVRRRRAAHSRSTSIRSPHRTGLAGQYSVADPCRTSPSRSVSSGPVRACCPSISSHALKRFELLARIKVHRWTPGSWACRKDVERFTPNSQPDSDHAAAWSRRP